MRTFKEIKDNYQFTGMEAETLKKLKPIIEPHADRLVGDFYNYFHQIPETDRLLKESAPGRLPALHKAWLLAMFEGLYDESYFLRLQRIGHAHVRIGLSAHFVYAGMNFLRLRILKVIESEVEVMGRTAAVQAVEKILDLNLDVIARTYHEEEMRRVFLSYKLDNALIRFARRFTFGLNLLLLVGLIALSLGVVAVLAHDISLIFRGSPEKGLV